MEQKRYDAYPSAAGTLHVKDTAADKVLTTFEVVDRLNELAAERDALAAEGGVTWALEQGGKLKAENDQLKARVANLEAERDRRVAALRPFALLAETKAFEFDEETYEVEHGYLDHQRYAVTAGDFRKAAEEYRAAVKEVEG